MSRRFGWVALFLFGCVPTEYCADTCLVAGDGECDDGRTGSVTGLCELGTDCTDCGAYAPAAESSPYRIENPGPVAGVQGDPDGECVPRPPSGCVPLSCTADGTHLVTAGEGVQPRCAGGVGTSCGAIMMPCPRIEGSSTLLWRCMEGPLGIGCYFDGPASYAATGRVVYCRPYGVCDNGVEIQTCVSMATFSQPTSTHPGFFDANVCASHFEFGDGARTVVHQCGSCQSACNLSRETAEQLCAQVADPDPDPVPPPVSSDCRVQIDAQLRMLRSAATTGCTSSCITAFASCAERSNCSNFTSCSSAAVTCLQRCIGS